MVFTTQNIIFDMVKTDADIQQILDLQQANAKQLLSEATRKQEGFVTVQHSLAQLTQMNQDLPQILAKADNQVIGYALAMSTQQREQVPELVSMFDLFDQLNYLGQPLNMYPYYVMGQICVAQAYRGKGIFHGLYETHRTLFSHNFRLCVTEISSSNARSLRAHEKVGFETIHTYTDDIDEWNIVIWDFEKYPKLEE